LEQQDNIVDAPNPNDDDLEKEEEYSAIDDKVTRIFTNPNVTISFDQFKTKVDDTLNATSQ
jgi:hypothetical protein